MWPGVFAVDIFLLFHIFDFKARDAREFEATMGYREDSGPDTVDFGAYTLDLELE